ncbi:hypothetical protein F4782DRAFT_410131 [Xylaria castorea]|nr:hypothetical protein F4782DRAFT_410131 [Xylaria castorea]
MRPVLYYTPQLSYFYLTLTLICAPMDIPTNRKQTNRNNGKRGHGSKIPRNHLHVHHLRLHSYLYVSPLLTRKSYKSIHNGCCNELRTFIQDDQVRQYSSSMELQLVPFRSALVDLRVPILQDPYLQSLCSQCLNFSVKL